MKNKLYILFFASLFGVCGCTKYLDLPPKSEASGEQIWSTAEGCRQLLGGGYAKLRKTLINENSFHSYGDLPSQCVFQENQWNWKNISAGEWAGAYHAYLPHLMNWKNFYQVITTVNTLLYHVNDVPATEFDKDALAGERERKKIAGEANFIYAYTYFWLVRIWGDVPLVKEAFESADQALEDGSTVGRKQSPADEVLTYVLRRLDNAVVDLDFLANGDDGYGVTADKASALALRAHILLWLANMKESEAEKRELIQKADESLALLIANSGRTLVDYSDRQAVYDMFDGVDSESIFELNVSILQDESFWVNEVINSIHGFTVWKEEFKIGTGHLVVADFARSTGLYDVKDIRRNLFFENFGNSNTSDKFPPMLTKYATGIQPDPATPNRFYANSNVTLLRLSDAYLLRAEAQYKLGNYGQARNILNIFRERAKTGVFLGGNDELGVEIFRERARELVGEGHSAFDRIRNDYWEGCSWANPDRIAKKGMYWPVDMPKLLPNNRELVQVPYWQGKL